LAERAPVISQCQEILINLLPTPMVAPTPAPVPWSLAWGEDGELAPQDRFDVLQCLVSSERSEVQTALIAAVETVGLSCSEMVEVTSEWA